MNLSKNKKLLSMLLLLIVAIVTFAISSKVVPLFDDIVYSFEHSYLAMKPDYSKRIVSFEQIIRNQYREYFMHNSRTLINVLVQTVMMIDYRIYYVLNSLMAVLFVSSVSRIVTKKWNDVTTIVLASVCVILFSYNIKQETIFWFTGAANYMWAITLGLYYIVPFVDVLKGDSIDIAFSNVSIIRTVILGFIVGWGTHIVNLVCWGFVICSMVYLFVTKQISNKTILLYALMLTPFVIGSAFLWLSPSNSMRSGAMSSVNDSFSLASIKENCSYLIKISFLTNPNAHLILITACVLLVYLNSNTKIALASAIVYSPLFILMATRNEIIYWELPEKLISLIYPTSILNGGGIYHNVSWNLQYYFYGFYVFAYCAVFVWSFFKNPKDNAYVSLLFFAGLCAGLTRYLIPVGSERTCVYSDILFVICSIGVYKQIKIINSGYLMCALLLLFAYSSVADYSIYNSDFKIYAKRKEILEACKIDSKCNFVELPAYSVKGYFDGSYPGQTYSAHSNYIIGLYDISDYVEYH